MPNPLDKYLIGGGGAATAEPTGNPLEKYRIEQPAGNPLETLKAQAQERLEAARQRATPGASPLNPLNEQGIDMPDRALIENTMQPRHVVQRFLEQRGFRVGEDAEGELVVQVGKRDPWKRINPQGVDVGDFAGWGGVGLDTLAQIGGGILSGPAGVAGGQAASSLARARLAGIGGMEPDSEEVAKQAALEGALAGTIDLAFGAAGRGAAKIYGKLRGRGTPRGIRRLEEAGAGGLRVPGSPGVVPPEPGQEAAERFFLTPEGKIEYSPGPEGPSARVAPRDVPQAAPEAVPPGPEPQPGRVVPRAPQGPQGASVVERFGEVPPERAEALRRGLAAEPQDAALREIAGEPAEPATRNVAAATPDVAPLPGAARELPELVSARAEVLQGLEKEGAITPDEYYGILERLARLEDEGWSGITRQLEGSGPPRPEPPPAPREPVFPPRPPLTSPQAPPRTYDLPGSEPPAKPTPKPTPRVEGQGDVVEVPKESITVDPHRFQHKEGATRKGGVVAGEQLEGSYQMTGSQPLLLWESEQGKLFLVHGHHRYDLALRDPKLKNVRAEIIRESEGFSAEQARLMGAEINIRDGQGSMRDYVRVFSKGGYDEATAQQKGLTSRKKGREAWELTQNLSEDAKAGYLYGRIDDDIALALARGAPKDAGRQQALLRYYLEHPDATAQQLEAMGGALSHSGPRQVQGEIEGLGGVDDTALREAESVARELERRRVELKKQMGARGAIKDVQMAKGLGVEVPDVAASKSKLAELKARLAELDPRTVFQNLDMVNELRRSAGLKDLAAARAEAEALRAARAAPQPPPLPKDTGPDIFAAPEQPALPKQAVVSSEDIFLAGKMPEPPKVQIPKGEKLPPPLPKETQAPAAKAGGAGGPPSKPPAPPSGAPKPKPEPKPRRPKRSQQPGTERFTEGHKAGLRTTHHMAEEAGRVPPASHRGPVTTRELEGPRQLSAEIDRFGGKPFRVVTARNPEGTESATLREMWVTTEPPRNPETGEVLHEFDLPVGAREGSKAQHNLKTLWLLDEAGNYQDAGISQSGKQKYKVRYLHTDEPIELEDPSGKLWRFTVKQQPKVETPKPRPAPERVEATGGPPRRRERQEAIPEVVEGLGGRPRGTPQPKAPMLAEDYDALFSKRRPGGEGARRQPATWELQDQPAIQPGRRTSGEEPAPRRAPPASWELKDAPLIEPGRKPFAGHTLARGKEKGSTSKRKYQLPDERQGATSRRPQPTDREPLDFEALEPSKNRSFAQERGKDERAAKSAIPGKVARFVSRRLGRAYQRSTGWDPAMRAARLLERVLRNPERFQQRIRSSKLGPRTKALLEEVAKRASGRNLQALSPVVYRLFEGLDDFERDDLQDLERA